MCLSRARTSPDATSPRARLCWIDFHHYFYPPIGPQAIDQRGTIGLMALFTGSSDPRPTAETFSAGNPSVDEVVANAPGALRGESQVMSWRAEPVREATDAH